MERARKKWERESLREIREEREREEEEAEREKRRREMRMKRRRGEDTPPLDSQRDRLLDHEDGYQV